jgi:hypothetical protein
MTLRTIQDDPGRDGGATSSPASTGTRSRSSSPRATPSWPRRSWSRWSTAQTDAVVMFDSRENAEALAGGIRGALANASVDVIEIIADA